MPSKEDICVVQETLPSKTEFLASDVEELVAAIKHKMQLKARPRLCSKHRRMSPYSAPVRTVCHHYAGDKENTTEHSSHCKYCIRRSKSPKSNGSNQSYEIQEYLNAGILIKEAVKRVQLDARNERRKKTDFYNLDSINDVEIDVESV